MNLTQRVIIGKSRKGKMKSNVVVVMIVSGSLSIALDQARYLLSISCRSPLLKILGPYSSKSYLVPSFKATIIPTLVVHSTQQWYLLINPNKLFNHLSLRSLSLLNKGLVKSIPSLIFLHQSQSLPQILNLLC